MSESSLDLRAAVEAHTKRLEEDIDRVSKQLSALVWEVARLKWKNEGGLIKSPKPVWLTDPAPLIQIEFKNKPWPHIVFVHSPSKGIDELCKWIGPIKKSKKKKRKKDGKAI